MSSDVIARPSPAGIAHRAAQLDRDRDRLLAQLEEEELDLPDLARLETELDPPGRVSRRKTRTARDRAL